MSNRRQVQVFVTSVLVLSWCFQAYIIANGGVRTLGLLWLVALMCIPGALSILLRLIFKLGVSDVAFRIGPPRFYVYAAAVPLLLALLAGCLASAMDIRHFAPATPDVMSQAGLVALNVLALGLVGAAGEEIGWRGFLLPKLICGRIKYPYFVTGLVWSLWHFPLIALGGFYQTNSPILMAVVYCLCIMALSYFISELRVRSGSVWVAGTAHAAHNFFFQFAVPALILTVPGSHSTLWDMVGGDTGLSVAALYVGAYLVFRHLEKGRPARSV